MTHHRLLLIRHPDFFLTHHSLLRYDGTPIHFPGHVIPSTWHPCNPAQSLSNPCHKSRLATPRITITWSPTLPFPYQGIFPRPAITLAWHLAWLSCLPFSDRWRSRSDDLYLWHFPFDWTIAFIMTSVYSHEPFPYRLLWYGPFREVSDDTSFLRWHFFSWSTIGTFLVHCSYIPALSSYLGRYLLNSIYSRHVHN